MSFRKNKNKNKKRTLKKLFKLHGGTDVSEEKLRQEITKRINYFGEPIEIRNFDKYRISNLQSLNLKDKIRKTRRLVFSECHGTVVSDGILKTVPDNIILCFLTPLNDENLYYDHIPQFKTFMERLMSITEDEFNNIFELRSKLREIALELQYSGTDKVSVYNCFLNSVWYYPGQKYTDIDLMMSLLDIARTKKKFNNLDLMLDVNKKVQSYPNPYIFEENRSGRSILNTLASRPILKDKLSRVLTKINGDTGYINLVLINCSRKISQDNIENHQGIFENEIAHYHYNLLLDKQNIQQDPPANQVFFKPGCYSLSADYDVIKYCVSENTNFLTKTLLPYDSYFGKIPSLQLLFPDRLTSENINKHNIRYLLHMPFKIIMLFFKKYELQMTEPLKTKIVDILMKNNYFLTRFTFFVQNLSSFYEKFFLIQNHIGEIELQSILEFITFFYKEIKEKKKKLGSSLSGMRSRVNNLLNLKTKIIEVMRKVNLVRRSEPSVEIINGQVTLKQYEEPPNNIEIDFLVVEGACTSLDFGKIYNNIKEIQVKDTQGFNYPSNTFDIFIGLEKLSIHIYNKFKSQIKIRNNYVYTLHIQGYNQKNNLSLALETPNLCGLYLINFNINMLMNPQNNFPHLRELDLVDCSFEALGFLLTKVVFTKILYLKLINVLLPPQQSILNLINQKFFISVIELHLENFDINIPDLLKNLEVNLPKLKKLTIIGNRTPIDRSQLDYKQNIMADLLQHKNSFTMSEVRETEDYISSFGMRN